MKYVLNGGVIVTPDMVIQGAAVNIENGRIGKIGQPDKDAEFTIHLSGNDLIFPGLINSHDHLLGNYYPRIGSGPYLNWLAWDNDLKSCDLYKERGKISNADLYELASYRNLVSGVTTVSDHIPHQVNESLINGLPVNVIKDYSLEHECSSYDLRWGRGITVEHTEARTKNQPFITHIEEGYDEEATLGIDILDYFKALDEYTVLIHGIALSDSDIDLIAKRNANLVWCPSSNYFMFKETTNIKRLLEKGVNIALGTDSPMSGSLNILEEMRFACSLYQKIYGKELDPKTVVRMVTVNAARALRLKNTGRIEEGCNADILVLKDGNPGDPYRSLTQAWYDNISMVFRNGILTYADSDRKDLAGRFHQQYQLLKINGKDRVISGKPLDLYERIWKAVEFKKILPFLPVDFY